MVAYQLLEPPFFVVVATLKRFECAGRRKVVVQFHVGIWYVYPTLFPQGWLVSLVQDGVSY